jgi:aryl-alcohol dehydrogenase-like predicted oxidoreductase
MSLIDTSGNYGNGRSEQFIGRAIAGPRDGVFLVTKVEAHEVAGDGIARACDASLARLGRRAAQHRSRKRQPERRTTHTELSAAEQMLFHGIMIP